MYKEIQPRTELRDFIECFWMAQFKGALLSKPVKRRILPDGCVDIIFDFKSSRQNHPAYLVGTMSRPLLVTLFGETDVLGIRFRPGAIRSFIKFIAAECTDDSAELNCFWGNSGSELWQMLAEISSTETRIAFLENYLLKTFGWALKLDPYIRHCVRRMQISRGNILMSTLEKETGLSARQIERIFARDVGLSPKAFARVIRFRNVIERATRIEKTDWSKIALENGYADQSHLIREFKKFADLTPSEFVSEQ